MARTQAEDYDERRTAIVDQAAALFARRGFAGTSINDIAAACGMSKSLLYHYFPSKEDLLCATMLSHLDALVAACGAIAKQADGAAERLAALSRAFMNLYAGAANRHKVLLNEIDNLPEVARRNVVAEQRQLIGFVETLLTEIAPVLADDRDRLRATAMLYFGMINWTHTWFDPKGPVAPATLAELASQVMLHGIVQPS